MARTADEYRDQLLALLPPGQAFPRETGTTLDALLDGMSQELARVDGRGEALIIEAAPLTTSELLPDWERVAGLPDKCAGTLETTEQGRRSVLVAKLASTGGQSPEYFIGVAAALGYEVTIDEFHPFRAGWSSAGDELTNDEWAFTWRVNAPEQTVITFKAGRSNAGEALNTWGNDTLECKINQLKPAHTLAQFAYLGTALYASFVENFYEVVPNLWSAKETKTFAELITFTRASVGTYINSSGVMQTAAINVPRLDHDPVTLQPLGLLIEEARTNLLLNSATLSTQNVTVTAAPTTLSFYGTGTITLSGAYSDTLVGTGSGRVSLSFTPSAGTLTVTVSGSVTNAQVETGPAASSYIPTTGAAVTRAADVATIPVGGWLNPYEGTLVAYGDGISGIANAAVLASIGNGSDYMARLRQTATAARFDSRDGGVLQADIILTHAPGVTMNMGMAYAVNDFAASLDGSAATVDSAGSMFTSPTQLYVGSSNGAAAFTNGHLREIKYYPRRLSNTELANATRL